MAEKGGKGFSVSKGRSALKTPASKLASLNLKAKDDGSSRKGRKVQVESSDSDSDDSVKEISGGPSKSSRKTSRVNKKTAKKVSFENLKSGGKASFDSLSGKGGSGDKTGKGGGKGRPPVAKILTEVELKLEAEFPKNAKILKDCEAGALLRGIQEYLPMLSNDPTIKIPISFDKALKYVQIVDHYNDSQSVTQALQKLKNSGATEGEICMIANVCPETTDEVYALIPSLKDSKDKNEGPIRDALAELAKLKRSE
uniref:DNA-directed RNA polymerase II subunit rpb4 n=1 Tax=Anthurium amnicola TaxID=1678845 RepID=A0A1D1XZE3_9ARAE